MPLLQTTIENNLTKEEITQNEQFYLQEFSTFVQSSDAKLLYAGMC